MNAKVLRRFTRFVREALPEARAADVRFGARLLVVTLESVGKTVASMRLSKREVRRWSKACAGMLSDQLGLPRVD